MDITVRLTRADVDAALAEYMQRALSTKVHKVTSAEADDWTITVSVEMMPERGHKAGTTRCKVCNGFGHNSATCGLPKAIESGDGESA